MQEVVDEMDEEDSDSSDDDIPLQRNVTNAAWKKTAAEEKQDDSDGLEEMIVDSEVEKDLAEYRLEPEITSI